MLKTKRQLNDTYAFPYTYDVIHLNRLDGRSEDGLYTVGGTTHRAETVTLIPEDAQLEDSVVKKIIGSAVARVEGALGMRGSVMDSITGAFSDNEITRGIQLQTDGSQAEVEIKVIALYGSSIPEVIRDIQENVHHDLLSMAGLNASHIQVDITDVMTQREYDEKYGK